MPWKRCATSTTQAPRIVLSGDARCCIESDGKQICDTCLVAWREREMSKGEALGAAFAERFLCTIAPPQVYHPHAHVAPTPEEYEAGLRNAHTPNSVAARNRHDATNYERIIKLLDRDDPFDRGIYLCRPGGSGLCRRRPRR